MSSMPPNPPGGGTPYPGPNPPYDPKTQWRVYRAQQRAAWRAQRQAWKAQRYAWRAAQRGAHAPSIVGPLVLIAIGVVWLLIYSGRLAADRFWTWYGRWWPAILIAAGLLLLGEWLLDLRRKTPVHRRSGFVGILFLVLLLGLCAAAWNHRQIYESWTWTGRNGDFFNFFGMPQHDFDQPALNQPIPANAQVLIDVPRGDVNVTVGEGPELQVQAHEVAFAGSDADARRIFAAERAAITANGNQVVVSSPENDHGRVNLAVTVPRSARVTVNSGWSDVTASGLGNGIDVTARGDIRLEGITGPVEAHFIHGRHDDIAMRQVNGDIKIDGDCNDLTLSEIKGNITQNGQLMGDVHIETVSGAVRLHTPVTEVEIASLPGDMTLDSDDLHVNEATGAVRVTTRAKDVDLNQIYGDSFVQDRDGTINVEPAGAYAIEARNGKGDVVVTLPPNAAAVVSGAARNGDILTDYGLAVSGDQNKTVRGTIGAGGAKIMLTVDDGDLHIKKGPAFPSTPPGVDSAASGPPGHVRHLRALKPLPAHPVTQ